jgi:Protein of unknown function (DUF402)
VRVGEPLLFRSIYRGNVRWCFPCRYVGEWQGRHGIYCQPGSSGKSIQRKPGKGYLDDWVNGVPPTDLVWEKGPVLRFMRPGDAHTIELCWDREWSLACWYVNLQAPLAVNGSRFDTTDWALDIVVKTDGSWYWKDEDEFAQAIELGVFEDAAAAAAVRAEGERVLRERPWPTGWEDWRPPSDWAPLPLPEDWHVV